MSSNSSTVYLLGFQRLRQAVRVTPAKAVRVTLASSARHSRKRCASPLWVSEKPIKYLAEGVSDRFRIITLFWPEIAFTDKYLDPAVFHFERDNPYTVAPTLA